MNKENGQMILLAVIIISSAVFISSAIGGYLMINKIKSVSKIVDLTKAIYAADAGIECELYNTFVEAVDPNKMINCQELDFSDNLTSVKTSTSTDSNGIINQIRSTGHSNKSFRSFELNF